MLSACVVASAARRSSTVYVLRVRRSDGEWHVHRCFSEFRELRDKLLAAATVACPVNSSNSTATSISQPSRVQLSADRLSSLLEETPTRWRLWPRTAVRWRAATLDSFLQQALALAREAQASQHIAVYFSVRTHLETFLECTKHADSMTQTGRVVSPEVAPPLPSKRPTLEWQEVTLMRPLNLSGEYGTSKWRCAADCWRDTLGSDCDNDSELGRDVDGSSRRSPTRLSSLLTERKLGCSPIGIAKDEVSVAVRMARVETSWQFCSCMRTTNLFYSYDVSKTEDGDDHDSSNCEDRPEMARFLEST